MTDETQRHAFSFLGFKDIFKMRALNRAFQNHMNIPTEYNLFTRLTLIEENFSTIIPSENDYQNEQIRDNFIQIIDSVNFRELNLISCDFVHRFPLGQSITHLNLENSRITDVNFLSRIQEMQNLASLNLRNTNINDDNVRNIIQYAPDSLTNLDISSNENIFSLSLNQTRITHLNIRGTRVISLLRRRFPATIQHIDASDLIFTQNEFDNDGNVTVLIPPQLEEDPNN